MKNGAMVITKDDIKIRKKSPPPAKPHKNPKAYTRKTKHAKRDAGNGSGPYQDGPLFFAQETGARPAPRIDRQRLVPPLAFPPSNCIGSRTDDIHLQLWQ